VVETRFGCECTISIIGGRVVALAYGMTSSGSMLWITLEPTTCEVIKWNQDRQRAMPLLSATQISSRDCRLELVTASTLMSQQR
jgi:hypothetical protein